MDSAMYYIAILAPGAIDEDAIQWKYYMRERFGCVVALKSPAHITLASPFWMKSDIQHLLEDAIREFSNLQKDFLIELKDFDCFKPRVIFIYVKESDDLIKLSKTLEEHLLKNPLFPIRTSTRLFHPHVTIANRDLHKNDFNTAWEYFRNKKYRASFHAGGIALMKHNGIRWEPAYTAAFPLI